MLLSLLTVCALAQAPEVRSELTQHARALDEIEGRLEVAVDDERAALGERLNEERAAFRDLLLPAIEAGVDPDFVAPALDHLREEAHHTQRAVERLRARVREQLQRRDSATDDDEAAAIDREVLATRTRQVGEYRALHEVDLGLAKLSAPREHRTLLDEALEQAADVQSGEVLSLAASIDAHPEGEDAALVRLYARMELSVAALDATLDLMEVRGQQTARYRQIMIASTGEITSDIFDVDVTRGLLSQGWSSATDWVSHTGPRAVFKLLVFVAILVASWLLARVARVAARRAIATTELTTLAKDFAVASAGRAVVTIGLVFALSQVGVDVSAVLAGLGIASLVIGFALQDTLSNFASGMMILAYRPFDVGDRITVAGEDGVVRDMTLVTTTLRTLDHKRVSIPNNKVWQSTITNLTAEPYRRVDLVFGVSYDTDLAEAERVILAMLDALPIVLSDPAPSVEVQTLGASSVDLAVRPWCHAAVYNDCEFSVTKGVKQALDTAGIEIPFPQQVVHHRDGRPR